MVCITCNIATKQHEVYDVMNMLYGTGPVDTVTTRPVIIKLYHHIAIFSYRINRKMFVHQADIRFNTPGFEHMGWIAINCFSCILISLEVNLQNL